MKSKIALFVFIGIFMISFASASNWDNWKSFDEKAGEHGKVIVTNWLGLGKQLEEVTLLENTYVCGVDCSAEKEITIYEDGFLIDDIRFLTLQKNGKWKKQNIRSYSLKYWDKESVSWIKFDAKEKFKSGTYKVRLDGKKKPTRTVDWQIKVQGKWVDEWAIWTPQLVIYDEINDSLINTSLWANTSSFAGDTAGSVNPTENTEYIEMVQFNNGLGGGVVNTTMEMFAYSLPQIETISNISMRVMLQANDTAGTTDDGGFGYIYVFGNQIFNITEGTGGGPQSVTDDSVWWIVRNTSKDGNYFGIYDDGGFVKEIQYINNSNISVRGNAFSNNNAGRALQRIYYVYEYLAEGAVSLESPENGYISPTEEVNITCSANVVGGATIVNISLFDNTTGTWSFNQSENVSSIGFNLTAYYRLDGTSGAIIDDQGVVNGTNDGATRGVDGIINNSFYFDNISYATLDSNGDGFGKTLCNNGCSVCAWINATDNLSIAQGIVSRWDDGVDNDRFISLITDGDSKLRFIIYQDGTNTAARVVSKNTFRENEWYQVCGTFNGTNISAGSTSIYLNGVFENSTPEQITIDSSAWADNEDVELGRRIIPGGGAYNFTGNIDEVGFWSRPLTSAEISEMYDSGNAKRASDYEYDTNVTFTQNINGVTLSTCRACDSDGDCGFSSNVTGTSDIEAPNITIITPTGTLGFSRAGQETNLNWTVSDDNLDSCWYDYNGTNITVTCDNNYTTITVEESNYNLTFYANDTLGYLSSEFTSWNYLLFEINQTFNAETFQTARENFTIWIDHNASRWNSVTAVVNYNGTEYPAVQFGAGNIVYFRSTIDIPDSGNRSFFWNFTLTNATATEYIVTGSNYQNSVELNFSTCLAGEKPYITFNTQNAENPFPALNATFKSSWDIRSRGSGSASSNFSYEDITETNNSWSFCLRPNSSNYTISVDVEVDATDFAKNFYYITDGEYDANETVNVTLYLLNDSLATPTTLLVRDRYQRPLEGVLTYIQLYDVGTDTFYTVGMGKSNQNGEDIVYLNWFDTLYKFVLVQSGSTILSTEPYKVGDTPQIFQIEENITYDFDKFRDFEYSLYFNNETQNFVLTYVKPSGLVDSGCLRVLKRTAQNDTEICLTCSESASATLYCNIAAYGNGTFIGTFYATGSLFVVDWISEEVGIGLSETIFNLLDKDDAAFYTILMSSLVLLIFLVNPVFGVLGILGGLLLSASLGFSVMSYGTFLFITCVGGAIIWLIRQ